MIEPLDLVAAFHRGLEEADTPRGDEEAAHVSDLGKCRLAVWARRNEMERIVRTPRSRARLQSGLRDEDWIVDLITAPLKAQGWELEHATEVIKSDLVGHWDIVLRRKIFHELALEVLYERRVVDVKTSEWRQTYEGTGEYSASGKEKRHKVFIPYDDAPGRAAILQVVGYARRLPLNPDGKHPPAAIIQYCRRSFQMAQFPSEGAWWDTDEPELVAEHDLETNEVIAQTAPGVDPVAMGIAIDVPMLAGGSALSGFPPMDTVQHDGSSWACRYCDFAACARNENRDAEVIS